MVQKRNKIIIGSGIVLVTVLLLLAAFTRQDPNKVTLKIIVVPTDSALTIDGTSAKAGDNAVLKGVHSLKATRQHFGDATVSIDTNKINVKQPVYVMPDPNTAQAKQYMKDHPDQQRLREQGAGANFSTTQKNLLQKYPVLDQLPHETFDFKIDYVVDPDKNVTFVVALYAAAPTANNQAVVAQQLIDFKKEALDYLKLHGVDASTAKITFTPSP